MKLDPAAVAAIEAMKNDLLIIFVERLGGEVNVPVAEVDDKPKGKGLALSFDPLSKSFTFKVIAKADA